MQANRRSVVTTKCANAKAIEHFHAYYCQKRQLACNVAWSRKSIKDLAKSSDNAAYPQLIEGNFTASSPTNVDEMLWRFFLQTLKEKVQSEEKERKSKQEVPGTETETEGTPLLGLTPHFSLFFLFSRSPKKSTLFRFAAVIHIFFNGH